MFRAPFTNNNKMGRKVYSGFKKVKSVGNKRHAIICSAIEVSSWPVEKF